jgi:hypothetical protein
MGKSNPMKRGADYHFRHLVGPFRAGQGTLMPGLDLCLGANFSWRYLTAISQIETGCDKTLMSILALIDHSKSTSQT